MAEFNINARRKARKLVLQALYQWQLSGESLIVIEKQFHEHNRMEKIDGEYFHELLHKIPQVLDALDAIIKPYLDRDLEQLNPIELILIRMSTYELQHRLDVPYKVVINEALELDKSFGSGEGHKYVNAVLDKIAQQLRAPEFQANGN